MKTQTRIMSLRLTEELSNKLFTIAKENEISVSEFTRKLYEEYFNWQNEKVVLSKVDG